MQELCLISLGYIYLAFNGIYYIYINIYIYISFIGISECMLLSSGARHRSCMFMAQAVAETLPTVDMVKKAMLSIGGDGDAEWGQVSGIAASPLTTGLNRLAGRFARQFFTKHLGCMGSPVRTMGQGSLWGRKQLAGPDCCGKCFVRFVMLKRVEVAWLRFILDSGEFSQ